MRVSVNPLSDPAFRSLAPQDVAFVNSDDDTASLTIDPVVGVASESGTTATYTVRLGSMPTATVRLVASVTGGDGRVTVVGGPVFVSPTQFYLPQTFVVSIADDLIDGADVPYTLTVSAESTDPLYSNRTATANGTALDNDVAGFVVSKSSLVVGENGLSASFTVQLTSQPIAPVRVDLAPSLPGVVTLSAPSLTFDARNWNQPPTVVVTGVDNFVAAPDLNLTLALTVVSSDATYASLTPPDVAITVVNDDVPGVLVSPTAFDVVEGGVGSFGVRLASQPTAPVTVTFATVGDVTLDVASLTFNAANWNVVQTVTVHGVDDPDINGDRPFTVRLLAATSADPNYQGFDPTDVTGLVHDNDVAQIVTTPLVGQVSEAGATATFTVRLTARPKAEVRIALATNAPTQATTDVPELVFDASNWNVAQTVVVRGTDDFVDDGDLPFDVLIGPATSTDRDFANLSGPTLASVVLDDDTAGVQIRLVSGQLSENGGQATYAVRLSSQPIRDVALVASSSDTTEGTLDTTNFTFDGANWDQEQTFVVQGVDDVFVDGDVGFALAFDAGGSADATYAGLTPTTTAIANADDDVADLVVTIDQAASTEGGETAQVRVRLASQPTSDVVVRIASSDPSEGTLQKSVLVFTAANWDQTQSVAVRGVDDAMNDGDQTYALAFVVQSADANYQGLARSTSLVNRDNDAIPAVFSVATTSTSGTGGTTTTTTAGSVGGATLPGGSTTPTSGGSATSVSGGTGGPAGDAGEPAARVANDPKEPTPTESANVPSNPLPPPAIQTLAAPLQGTPNPAPTPNQTTGQPASGQPTTPVPSSPRPTTSVSPGATYVSGIPGVLAQLTPAQEQARDADLASRSAVQRQLLGEFLDPVASENRTNRVVTATVATTVVATAGYALLATRLASWVFTLATAQPVWLRFDPMHILSAWEKDRKRKRDDDESLQTMVNRHRKTAPVL